MTHTFEDKTGFQFCHDAEVTATTAALFGTNLKHYRLLGSY